MKTIEEHLAEYQASLERADELFSSGVGVAKANYERLLAFYTKQKEDMIAAANKRLTEGKATIETHNANKLLRQEAKKKEKEEKASKPKEPRVRRTKEEIEIEKAKQRLKKQYDESHKRHLEGKSSSSNTAPPITSTDRNRLEVFGGVSSFLGFNDEEEEEDKDDGWDSQDERDAIEAARKAKEVREKRKAEEQKKKSRVPEPEEVIIPEEELTPLPPPKPQTLSKQEERRKPVKQVKGVHSYSLPLE